MLLYGSGNITLNHVSTASILCDKQQNILITEQLHVSESHCVHPIYFYAWEEQRTFQDRPNAMSMYFCTALLANHFTFLVQEKHGITMALS